MKFKALPTDSNKITRQDLVDYLKLPRGIYGTTTKNKTIDALAARLLAEMDKFEAVEKAIDEIGKGGFPASENAYKLRELIRGIRSLEGR